MAALLAVQQGDLSLEDPVHRWLPELSHRSVLCSPEAELDDVVPAARDITVRDLLINGCGYGLEMADIPLARGMADRGVDASPDQDVGIGSGEWLRRLATLPLAHQPGDGFRHHHGFGVLGILLQRMSGLGFYAGAPVLDTAHGELVSTARDYLMFARMLADGGRHEGGQILDAALVTEMTRDQVAPVAKTPESMFPGFWKTTGWGHGISVMTAGDHVGRLGWSGGQGTTFHIDPDGTIVIFLSQVQSDDDRMWDVFQQVHELAPDPT